MHDIFVIICIEFFWVKKKKKIRLSYLSYTFIIDTILFALNFSITVLFLLLCLVHFIYANVPSNQTNDNEDNSKTFDIDVCNKN